MSTNTQPAAAQGSTKALLSRLRSYFLFVPLIYFYTFVMGTLSLLSSLFDRSGRVQHWFARTWSSMILKTLRISVHVEGLEHVDFSKPAVYAANHLSAADIPVLYTCLPMQFRILAKKELFRYPFLGWHLRRSGQIPIDPDDARASLRSLNRASEALRHGTPLVVFPEGGRSPSGQLQDFMAGGFYVAIRAHAPVVPVVIVGTYELAPMNSFHVRPGSVQLILGKPIPSAGMKPRDMEKMARQVHDVIAETYYSRARVTRPTPANNQGKAKEGFTDYPVGLQPTQGDENQSR
jgi:1-acyl-sn-glycerol-3-phosphate acyltransferase